MATSSILLPLVPSTLPEGSCYTSEQQRLNSFADALNAVLGGSSGSGLTNAVNVGTGKPDPSLNTYPWFNLNDGRWYFYSGGWISPVNYDANERRLFVGDLTALQTYDGGDTNAPSDRSGPMWVQDTEFIGRSPMGPGAIPTSNPAKTLSVVENYGEGAHVLTTAELASHSHNVLPDFDRWHADGNTGDAGGGLVGSTAHSNTSISWGIVAGPSGGDQAHNTIHPVRGTYIVKWSGRLYRSVP